MDLSMLTSPQLKVAAPQSIAILPIGALEPHGPHLPLATDTMIAEFFAQQLSHQVDGIVMPAISYGCRTNSQRMGGEFAGTFDVRAATMMEHVLDLLSACYREGFRKFNIVDAAIANVPFVANALQRFSEMHPDVRLISGAWWDYTPESVRDEIADQTGTARSVDHHAAMVETSLVMHISPSNVRTENLRPYPPGKDQLRYTVLPMPDDLRTEDGVVFQNFRASAEIGRRISDLVIENMVKAALGHLATLDR